MKLKKIERPNKSLVGWVDPVTRYARFCAWFDREIEPINKLIEGAVEVGRHRFKDSPSLWTEKVKGHHGFTHKAWIIGKTQIGPDSAEKVLRDFMDAYDSGEDENSVMDRFYSRAKKILGGEG